MTLIVAGDDVFDTSLQKSVNILSQASTGIVVVFMYNLLLTFDDEVIYVWKKRWGLGSVMYMLARYTPAVCIIYDLYTWLKGLLSCSPCTADQIIASSFAPAPALFYPGVLVLIFSLILQQLRTVAIFEGSRKLKAAFVTLDLAAAITIVALKVILPTSTPDETANLLTYILIPLFIIETITFGLCLYKSYTTYIRLRDVLRSPLMEIILRNNIIYFILMFFIYFFGLLFGTAITLDGTVINLHFIASTALGGYVAPLLYINLRKSCDTQAAGFHLERSLSAPVWALTSLPQEWREEQSWLEV